MKKNFSESKKTSSNKPYTPKFLNIKIIAESEKTALNFIKDYGYDTNYLSLSSSCEKQIKEFNGDILYEMSQFTRDLKEKIIVEVFNFKNKKVNSKYIFSGGKYKKEF